MAEQLEAVFLLIEKSSVAAVLVALQTMASLLDNVAADAAKYGTLKTANKGLQNKILSLEGGEAALVALGFAVENVRRWTNLRWYHGGRAELLDKEQPDLVLILAAKSMR